MEIMYALIVGVIVMLGVIAYAVNKNKTVYILKEIEKKEAPKEEAKEEPKEEPKEEKPKKVKRLQSQRKKK